MLKKALESFRQRVGYLAPGVAKYNFVDSLAGQLSFAQTDEYDHLPIASDDKRGFMMLIDDDHVRIVPASIALSRRGGSKVWFCGLQQVGVTGRCQSDWYTAHRSSFTTRFGARPISQAQQTDCTIWPCVSLNPTKYDSLHWRRSNEYSAGDALFARQRRTQPGKKLKKLFLRMDHENLHSDTYSERA